jgi:hypothetical protein
VQSLRKRCVLNSPPYLSLPSLSAGAAEDGMVKLHYLQVQYYSEQCARARTPSHNSAQVSVLELHAI